MSLIIKGRISFHFFSPVFSKLSTQLNPNTIIRVDLQPQEPA